MDWHCPPLYDVYFDDDDNIDDDIINNNINSSDDIIDALLIDYSEVECKTNKEGAQNNYWFRPYWSF